MRRLSPRILFLFVAVLHGRILKKREDILTLTNDDIPKMNPAFKAWKLSSTQPMIQSLIDDNPQSETILLGAAWNPVTPERIVDFLSGSDFPRVSAAAKNRLGIE